jgi:hypothetical protein
VSSIKGGSEEPARTIGHWSVPLFISIPARSQECPQRATAALQWGCHLWWELVGSPRSEFLKRAVVIRLGGETKKLALSHGTGSSIFSQALQSSGLDAQLAFRGRSMH